MAKHAAFVKLTSRNPVTIGAVLSSDTEKVIFLRDLRRRWIGRSHKCVQDAALVGGPRDAERSEVADARSRRRSADASGVGFGAKPHPDSGTFRAARTVGEEG